MFRETARRSFPENVDSTMIAYTSSHFAPAQEAYGVLLLHLSSDRKFADFVETSIELRGKKSEWLITAAVSSSPVSTVVQSSRGAEHEIRSPSSDSWSDAQLPDLCTSWTSATRRTCALPQSFRAFLNTCNCLTSFIRTRISARRTRGLGVWQLREDHPNIFAQTLKIMV